MATLLVTAYFVVLGALSLFGLHRLHLTIVAGLAARRRAARVAGAPGGVRGGRPDLRVVVQLPLYDEPLVAERLIRAAAALDWPRDQLEIQVLDDSTDETRAIVHRVVAELAAAGTNVTVLRRPTREGYKAGALAFGLARTDAELVAVFDADFVPSPDFLRRTVPTLLADDGCAMVQARWGHLNRERSMLTRAQGVFLDGHFAIEHEARSASGRFFNFNGTAGVWRRRAIEDAGGWGFETITEDLELSYRVQLAGWRFAYVGDVVAPAELPESWSAFRTLQARWVRGSIETARLHLRRVLAKEQLPRLVRFDAAVHLGANVAYLFMSVLALLLPAVVVLRSELGWAVPGGRLVLGVLDVTMLGAGTCAMIVFYVAALLRTEGSFSTRRAVDVAFALCVGAGMSLSNAREVIAGLFTRRSIFVRTPKQGDATRERALAVFRMRAPLVAAAVELTFAGYFLAVIRYALEWSLWPSLPFLLLYFVGFVAVGGGEVVEVWRRRALARAQDEIDGVELPRA